MHQIEITAELRTKTGSAESRRIRRAGKIPAVLYGHETKGIALSLDARTTEKLLGPEGHSGLIDLKINGEAPGISQDEKLLVLIKSHQADPISRLLTHLDLYKVNLKEEVNITVPLHYEGTAPGVKAGGILDVIRRDIDIFCLPTKIPEYIVVDVSQLEQGHSIHAQEVPLPEGVSIDAEATYTLVTVVAPKGALELEAAEAEAAEAAAAEAAAEVEVDQEKKEGE